MDTETKVMTQLSYIIARMSKDIKEKIPIDIRKEISKKKDNHFISVYDNNLPLFEQDLLPDTKAVLSILYSKYICSNEERIKWDEYDRYKKKLLIKKQQELENEKGHYNSDELFKNKIKNPEFTKNSVAIIECKESFFSKIKSLLKRIIS